MQTDILIVGGGLSGLSLARQLAAVDRDYALIEARDRFGGRVLSESISSAKGSGSFDLGPAWFWPGQPRMAGLVNELGLTAFEQYASGRLVLEETDGSVQRDLDFATMGGSLRIVGGVGCLIQQLVDGLPSRQLKLSHALVELNKNQDGIQATVRCCGGERIKINCKQVVLAIPPRIAAQSILFTPVLPESVVKILDAIPTWMAGHAKVVAVYEQAFWRFAGLSGDGISRRGPMVEIHDASPLDLSVGALFGFVGVPAMARASGRYDLKSQSIQQLARMFGPQASDPLQVFIKDWAFESYTAIDADQAPLNHHPQYGLPAVLDDLWDGRLHFVSSELAPDFGGYLEGALAAAEQVFPKISLLI